MWLNFNKYCTYVTSPIDTTSPDCSRKIKQHTIDIINKVMDKIENKNKVDKGRAVNAVNDDDSCKKRAANLPVPAANSSHDPFVDTEIMVGRRGERNQENNQSPVVASVTGRLTGGSTAETHELLSSFHPSSDIKYDNNNTNMRGILLETKVLSDRQLDATTRQQGYAEAENAKNRSIHVDTGTTNSSGKITTKGTSKTHHLDKNDPSKSVVCNSTPPLSKHSVKPTGKDQLQKIPTHPGAIAMFPGGNGRSVLPPPHNDITFMNTADHNRAQATTVVIGASDVEAGEEPTLKAFLVNDDTGVLASATLLDVEADEQKNLRRRRRTILGSFITASIIATAVAVSVVLTRSGPAQTIIGLPTSSPFPSAVPSFIPTSSPSTALFGFLVANSFDGGSALDIPGSSQQMALDWLVNVYGIFEMDYHLLQNYALVTLYFETDGKQWISTEDFNFKHSVVGSTNIAGDDFFTGEWLNITPSVNPLGFCSWQGVECNNNREIDTLTLSSNRLNGFIPAELGILQKSLSKSHIDGIADKIMSC